MPPRARRSDSVANRERILDAARTALSRSNGSVADLTLQAVARDAEVGQGTLYRHFPTREHLAAQVYRQEVGELVDAVPVLLDEHPPLDALTRWLDQLLEYARVKRGVMAVIEASVWQDLYEDHHARLDEALADLLDRGHRAGVVRADADAIDVILLLGALTRIPSEEWDHRAPRIVATVVAGLRETPSVR